MGKVKFTEPTLAALREEMFGILAGSVWLLRAVYFSQSQRSLAILA